MRLIHLLKCILLYVVMAEPKIGDYFFYLPELYELLNRELEEVKNQAESKTRECVALVD